MCSLFPLTLVHSHTPNEMSSPAGTKISNCLFVCCDKCRKSCAATTWLPESYLAWDDASEYQQLCIAARNEERHQRDLLRWQQYQQGDHHSNKADRAKRSQSLADARMIQSNSKDDPFKYLLSDSDDEESYVGVTHVTDGCTKCQYAKVVGGVSLYVGMGDTVGRSYFKGRKFHWFHGFLGLPWNSFHRKSTEIPLRHGWNHAYQ